MEYKGGIGMEFIPAKTIVTRCKGNDWFGIDYKMNIYKGCSHGCIYCDSRSSCYGVENFDVVKAKKDALQIIRRELRGKIKSGVIGTGSMADPYNPMEAKYGLTRSGLELIAQYGFGVAIATKSPLVIRDIDILKEIKRTNPVLVKMTITTCDDTLSKIVEPHVAPTSERFKAIKTLSEAGITCGLLLMPVLPFIEDNERNIKEIVRQAALNGARFIYPAIGMTLRDNQREYYFEALDKHFPGLQQKYIENFGNSYECTSIEIKKLWQVFTTECKKYGLIYKMKDIINLYQSSYKVEQLSLF